MTENTDEEPSEEPISTPPENTAGDIIPTNDSISIKPVQETENMEVHHHAHHEGKRSWKSYVWEFLMLFLAVFCGFLAEYKLEHMIERQREKEYAKALFDELYADSIVFTQKIEGRLSKEK